MAAALVLEGNDHGVDGGAGVDADADGGGVVRVERAGAACAALRGSGR